MSVALDPDRIVLIDPNTIPYDLALEECHKLAIHEYIEGGANIMVPFNQICPGASWMQPECRLATRNK